jgi:CHAT domain-containing protein
LLPVAFAPFGQGEDSLADRMPVAVALSAETLRLSRDRPQSRSMLTLAVGDPLGDTPFAAYEVNEVLRQARERDADTASMVLLHSQASTSAVAAQLARGHYGVAHFACHGVYDQDRPLGSGLALADGWLTLGELLDAELAPFRGVRLAVLSACESAMSTTAGPDEALGLPAAVTYAGAGCVIGSLWLVEDSASYLLMARFHSELRKLFCAEGIPAWAPAQALRRAQRWLRSATAGRLREQVSDLDAELAGYLVRADPQERPYQHPAFWAPFVVVGH